MAKRRTRGRSGRQNASRVTARTEGVANGSAVASVLPRVLVGAVNGVEIVAVGALQLARDVLLTTVSGAANIGAEALTATTAGARGVVSATSAMLGDIAGTAESTFRNTLYNVRHSRPGARMAPRRSAAPTAGSDDATTASQPSSEARGRRSARRRRAAVRGSSTRTAA